MDEAERPASAGMVGALVSGIALGIAAIFNMLHRKGVIGRAEARAELARLIEEVRFENPMASEAPSAILAALDEAPPAAPDGEMSP